MVMGTSVCMCVSMGACACVHCVNVCTGYVSVFSPEFTGRRAQIIFHDHTPHLEHSDC